MVAATIGAAEKQPSAAAAHSLASEPPEGFWYSVKRRVLGPPLVTEQLTNERLSRPLALGVLSCDGLHGTVGIGANGHPAMINPGYELLR